MRQCTLHTAQCTLQTTTGASHGGYTAHGHSAPQEFHRGEKIAVVEGNGQRIMSNVSLPALFDRGYESDVSPNQAEMACR